VRRWLFIAACLVTLPVLLWGVAVLRSGSLPSTGYGGQADLVVLASDGSPLGGVAHRQHRAGPWLRPEQISPLIRSAALAAEDKRFPHHPGVDPLALIRAAWQNLLAGRVVSGGSTISMQLARLERPARRTLWAKLNEAARALWLEARLGKDQILCYYLNRAPFGGPLTGLGAASRHLLGKSPERLSPAEAALLMALPKDPARLLKQSARTRLKARRDYILRRMTRAGDLDQASLSQALAAPIRLNPLPGPPAPAPHFIREIASRLPLDAARSIYTHLDTGLQRRLNSLVAATCLERPQEGLRQAAVLVIRNSDRAVVAWVGSPDWHDPASGQVDGVTALRSPGSALKPFLYALALESGRTLADVIADEPLTLEVAGGAFRPVDYDGQARGPVRLRIALASSLNLPALRLVRELTPAAFLLRLRKLGFYLPQSADHYGLALTLGDGEVSLLELTSAYAALANSGAYQPPLSWNGQHRPAPKPVMDAAAARLVTDALADDRAREIGFGRHGALELPFPAAVKTGTSQQHRDNWCVGFTKEFTVGVWVGNFQGKPMAGISGVTGAGPLWRQAMLLVHQGRSPALPPWPPDVERRRICAQSGSLPASSGKCPIIEEVFVKGSVPRNTCALHKSKTMAASTPAVGNKPKAHLDLLVPAPGAVYAMDPDVPPDMQVLALQAKSRHVIKGAAWLVDGKALTTTGNPLEARLKLTPGRHVVELAAWGDWGRVQTKGNFEVLGGPQAPTNK
jgi:penicillin-binding protein 1C